jgi:hypothetical protein
VWSSRSTAKVCTNGVAIWRQVLHTAPHEGIVACTLPRHWVSLLEPRGIPVSVRTPTQTAQSRSSKSPARTSTRRSRRSMPWWRAGWTTMRGGRSAGRGHAHALQTRRAPETPSRLARRGSSVRAVIRSLTTGALSPLERLRFAKQRTAAHACRSQP